LCSHIENGLYHVLGSARTLKEELDNSCEELKLDLRALVLEALQKALQKLSGIIDALGILTNNPDHRCLGLRLIERLQVLAECSDDTLIFVGVATEDILDNNNGLLDDVVDLGLDQVKKDVYALLSGTLKLNGTTSNGTDSLADELNIDFLSVLLKLKKNLVDILVIAKHNHDLELVHLNINRVVVLAEENLHFVLKNGWALLKNQVDVAEGNILDFGFLRQKGNCIERIVIY
jgi:hypothetical protein